MASTAPAHDAVIDGILAVAPRSRVRELNAAGVRHRCDSPRFRRGLFVGDDATVQPARLSLGLRARVREAGVDVFERSRVRALHTHAAGVTAETSGGRVRAGAAVLAVNAATRGFGPLSHRLSVTSSHIVLTEPVPDVLEELGWSGGECITDARVFVHYFRTTRDDRIAFGWGGGRLAPGARLGGKVEVDAGVAAETRDHLVDMFPALAGRAITHAWGGPIDVSPEPSPADGHARRRPGPLRVRLHRQRRRPFPPGRPGAGRVGLGRVDRPGRRRSRARPRPAGTDRIRGRDAGPPCLFA